ncbi:S41 family peptidase [Algibacter pacificus]|uniref:S41 family peptidase n=1 Tax=Algibacter pacificus TaxID=2599389 RepID=UPI0011C88F09|nr:S41 family peptidase [Algibacter pacificus]
MKKIITILILVIATSCSKVIIEENEPNTKKNNFEILWNDFDQHYSLFVIRDINWNDLYDRYQPQVNENQSDDELWTLFSNLLEHLDDSHTVMYDGNGNSYRSGYKLNKQSINEISKTLIEEKYIEEITTISSEDDLLYSKIKNKNIGYIYLGTMDGSNPAVMDNVVAKLEAYDAIILDIRQNTGGEDRYSARIAQSFSDGRHLVYTVQTRNGPNHNDFDSKTEYFTKFNNSNTYNKPVVVLTDRKTISAGEVFLLHMKAFNNVIQIGDTTAGDFSTLSNMRFLPNGWHYQYSIQKFLLPNGESLDGIGHIPDVYVKNTEADIKAGNDTVLDTAIQHLFNEFGIE